MLVASGTSLLSEAFICVAAFCSCGSVTFGRPPSVCGSTTRVLVAVTTSPTVSLVAIQVTMPPPTQSTRTTARTISRILPTPDFFGGTGAPNWLPYWGCCGACG